MNTKYLIPITIVALTLSVVRSSAQDYTPGTAYVSSVIINTHGTGSGTTYGAGGTGGTVTATSAASSGSTGAHIQVEFGVDYTYNGPTPTRSGSVKAYDDCTGNQTYGTASSGYIYSPWLSIIHSTSEANPYTFNERRGPWADLFGNTSLYIIADAQTYCAHTQGGNGSAYADSVVSLVLQ